MKPDVILEYSLAYNYVNPHFRRLYTYSHVISIVHKRIYLTHHYCIIHPRLFSVRTVSSLPDYHASDFHNILALLLHVCFAGT